MGMEYVPEAQREALDRTQSAGELQAPNAWR